jgi:hypothetical protein
MSSSSPQRIYENDGSREADLLKAVLRSDAAAVERFIAEGIQFDFGAPEYGGECPLALAAGQGHVRIMEILIAASADIDFPSEEGTTPLIAAACYGSRPALAMLISRGADVNALSAGGTALDVATAKQHRELCSILRDAGALTKREVKYGSNRR